MISKALVTPVVESRECVLSLLHDKILDWSIFKSLADNKINVTQNLKFVLGKVENIWEKEKMLVTSIFSFSKNVFKSILLEGRDCVVKS